MDNITRVNMDNMGIIFSFLSLFLLRVNDNCEKIIKTGL